MKLSSMLNRPRNLFIKCFIHSLTIFFSFAFIDPMMVSGQSQLSPEEIIQKHITAIGSKEAVSSIKTRIAIGTFQKEEDPANDFYLMSERDKLSAFYKFRDYDLQMIFDGSSTVIRPVLGREASPVTDKYEEIVASGLMFNGMSVFNNLASLNSAINKMELKGQKKIGGRAAYLIQLKQKNSSINLYFDTETFMWLRTDFGKVYVSANIRDVGGSTARLNEMKTEGGSETTIDFYIETSDFREVNGIKLPFKFVQVVTSPILRKSAVGRLTGTIREYKHNELIDTKMFK